jgi:electron transfer flavoprotein beta subunit
MSSPTAITVLVSTTCHPTSGIPMASRNDVLALEIGRRLSHNNVRVLHVGDPEDPALTDYLAFGGHLIEVLPITPGDHVITALAGELSEAQLILCGCRAQSGMASGILPYLLAKTLDRPVLTDVLDIEVSSGKVQAVQFLPKGRRRCVELTLPAIVAIHPLTPAVPRYAYARKIAGRIKTLPRAASPDADTDTDAPTWRLDTTARAPLKLKAPDRRTGHARMLAATSSTNRGGRVVNEGSDVEKAQAMLAYLREHALIELPRKRAP